MGLKMSSDGSGNDFGYCNTVKAHQLSNKSNFMEDQSDLITEKVNLSIPNVDIQLSWTRI